MRDKNCTPIANAPLRIVYACGWCTNIICKYRSPLSQYHALQIVNPSRESQVLHDMLYHWSHVTWELPPHMQFRWLWCPIHKSSLNSCMQMGSDTFDRANEAVPETMPYLQELATFKLVQYVSTDLPVWHGSQPVGVGHSNLNGQKDVMELVIITIGPLG